MTSVDGKTLYLLLSYLPTYLRQRSLLNRIAYPHFPLRQHNVFFSLFLEFFKRLVIRILAQTLVHRYILLSTFEHDQQPHFL